MHLDHDPSAGVSVAAAGLALEALCFGLTHHGHGLLAAWLVKRSGTFSGTRKLAVSFGYVFFFSLSSLIVLM